MLLSGTSRLTGAGRAAELFRSPKFLEFVCCTNNNNQVKFLSYEKQNRSGVELAEASLT
jgi:hypothetical protein